MFICIFSKSNTKKQIEKEYLQGLPSAEIKRIYAQFANLRFDKVKTLLEYLACIFFIINVSPNGPKKSQSVLHVIHGLISFDVISKYQFICILIFT